MGTAAARSATSVDAAAVAVCAASAEGAISDSGGAAANDSRPAASGSMLVCAVGATGTGAAGALAAMAAAARASGAAAPPIAGIAAGTSTRMVATEIATATAFGVASELSPCCAGASGSVAEFAPDDGVSVDCSVWSFERADFVGGRSTAVAFGSALAFKSEVSRAPESRSSEVLFAVRLAGSGRDGLSSALPASLARRWDVDGCWVELALSLPVSAAMLESTNATKASFCCDASGRPVFCRAAWKGRGDAASDVTLNTGRGLSK